LYLEPEEGATGLFAARPEELPHRSEPAYVRGIRDVLMAQSDGSNGAVGPSGEDGRRSLDPSEFSSIRPQLLSVVRRVCPRWLAHQAEDIVQSAIVQVLERSRRERGGFEVSSSYLMRAAHNAAVDEIRRRFRRPEVSAGDEESGMEHEASAAGPERQAESRQIDAAIRACLAGLARPRRAAVTLFLLGYSLSETEHMSDWSRKRSEHLTYRGLADMRRCLTSKGMEP
jgi:RNA polymerase sigma-70 factor (ECF subfamily)